MGHVASSRISDNLKTSYNAFQPSIKIHSHPHLFLLRMILSHQRTCSGGWQPSFKSSAGGCGKSNVYTWTVRYTPLNDVPKAVINPSSELQGHAIKNQDLLIASGVISSKGIDKMTQVEEDMQAVCITFVRPA